MKICGISVLSGLLAGKGAADLALALWESLLQMPGLRGPQSLVMTTQRDRENDHQQR